MKTLSHSFLCLILVLFSTSVFSQEIAERKVEKDFSPPPGKIRVESTFGKVEVLSWDQNRVQVNAHLWVESKNKVKAENLLERMDVDIQQDGNVLVVKSIFPGRMSSGNDTKFQIDFTIQTPADMDIDLESKYGSVFIEKISGSINVDVAYGNFKADELLRGKEKPLNQLKLAYSSGSISEAGWLKTDLAYSKLSVNEAEALVVLSKYSGISVDESSSVVTESKYDSYKIEEINNYSGQHKFSNLSIDELSSRLEIDGEYSTIKVDDIGENFELIQINNSKGGCKLNISENASFILTGEAHRGDITVSGIDEIDKNVENTNKYVNGKHGNNPRAEIKLNITDGSCKIKLE